jgi:DNA-binding response OmpR family regulator
VVCRNRVCRNSKHCSGLVDLIRLSDSSLAKDPWYRRRAGVAAVTFVRIRPGSCAPCRHPHRFFCMAPGCNRAATTDAASWKEQGTVIRGPENDTMRVLVVEDDEEVAQAIGIGLRRAGMAVDVVFDGRTGLQLVLMGVYDVVVLDRDLPEVHGDEVCARIVQAEDRTRILMLTASGAVDERVDGLARGADDYLTKPFALPELIARIRTLSRRTQPRLPPALIHRDLELDIARHLARRRGDPLFLAPKEFALLEVLLGADGRVLSTEELLDRVWDDTSDPETTAVKVTIFRLRRKLGDPPLIETVGTLGYRIPRCD